MNSRCGWLVHWFELRVAGEVVLPVDQHRHDDAAAVLGQPAGELRFLRHARRQADEHLRRPVGVGDRDDLRDDLALRLQQQALAIDALEHRPADGVDLVEVGLGDQRRHLRRRRRTRCRRTSSARRPCRGSSSVAAGLARPTSRRPPATSSRASSTACASRRTRPARAVRYLSIPATIFVARSSLSSRGWVLGRGSAPIEAERRRVAEEHEGCSRGAVGQVFQPVLRPRLVVRFGPVGQVRKPVLRDP